MWCYRLKLIFQLYSVYIIFNFQITVSFRQSLSLASLASSLYTREPLVCADCYFPGIWGDFFIFKKEFQ